MTKVDSGQKRGADWVGLAAIATTIIGWASAFAAIRVGLTALSPVGQGRDLLRLGVIGVLFISAYAVLLNTGEQTIAAGPAAFIIQINPIIVALIAVPLLGERFGL
jgi:drug/metabolite transporter (DMT)-like permease